MMCSQDVPSDAMTVEGIAKCFATLASGVSAETVCKGDDACTSLPQISEKYQAGIVISSLQCSQDCYSEGMTEDRAAKCVATYETGISAIMPYAKSDICISSPLVLDH